jgi:hypothetical protein
MFPLIAGKPGQCLRQQTLGFPGQTGNVRQRLSRNRRTRLAVPDPGSSDAR